MANINLSHSSHQKQAFGSSSKILDKSMGLSLGIITITAAVLFGVKFYAGVLDKEKASLASEIEAQTKVLKGEGVARVVDFHKRSEFIAKKMSNQSGPQDIMAQVEKSMLPMVSLESYQYDASDKSLTLEAITDNFKNVPQQVLNFKSAFGAVLLENSGRDDSGNVAFTVKIIL
jgi:hypothetical protein